MKPPSGERVTVCLTRPLLLCSPVRVRAMPCAGAITSTIRIPPPSTVIRPGAIRLVGCRIVFCAQAPHANQSAYHVYIRRSRPSSSAPAARAPVRYTVRIALARAFRTFLTTALCGDTRDLLPDRDTVPRAQPRARCVSVHSPRARHLSRSR